MTDAPRPRPLVHAIPGYTAAGTPASIDVALLASNESPFGPLPSVFEAMASAARAANRYPEIASHTLQARLAEELRVADDQVMVGAGSLGVLHSVLSAFVEPGDEVVIAWRSFEAYPKLITLLQGETIRVPLRADEANDLDAMADAITDRTRAVIVCTPNNPTGVSVTHAEVARFLERVPSNVLVVLDEAYCEFAVGAGQLDAISLMRRYENVVVLRTFSKAYGLAALRVGYGIAAPSVAAAGNKMTLPFAVSSLAQQAAVASLDAVDEIADRITQTVIEREQMMKALATAGWTLSRSSSNFLWFRLEDEDSAELLAWLERNDILARRYAGDGIRITMGDADTNERLVAVLVAYAQRQPASV